MGEALSALELCRPPAGHRFSRGVWLTYGVDIDVLLNTVSVALTGAEARDPRGRALQAMAGGHGHEGILPELLVLHGVPVGLPVPLSWQRVIRVPGRRVLHAKLGMLEFRPTSGSGRRLRAFVTSANLTRDGLLSNRELIVHEKDRPTAAGLGLEVLEAVDALVADVGRELPSRDREDAERILSALRGRAARRAGTGGRLLHTLGAAHDPLLSGLYAGHAKRIVIISPPYAGERDAGGPEALRPWIGPTTRVEVFTGADTVPGQAIPGWALTFSSGALAALRSRSEEVMVYGVPTREPHDEGGERRRLLHAKLIAIERHDGTVELVVGSANFTSRGLLGRNREAAIRLEFDGDRLEALLSPLDARPVAEEPKPVTDDHADAGVAIPVPSARLIADESEPVGARPSVGGRLEVEPAPGWEIVELLLRGRPLSAQTVEGLLIVRGVRLPLTSPALSARVRSGAAPPQPVQVPVRIIATSWAEPDLLDEAIEDEPELLALLSFMRSFARGPGPTSVGEGRAAPRVYAVEVDGFLLPLAQLLVLVARHRAKLREYLAEADLARAVEKGFQAQAERRVARALLGIVGNEDEEPLLRLVVGAADDGEAA